MTQPFLDNEQFYFTSWQQTHGTLFQAIKLEKRLISLMLFLIITVAAFNILSTIVMTVKTKEKEIAILKTMGCSKTQLTFIFLNLGLIIGFLGVFATDLRFYYWQLTPDWWLSLRSILTLFVIICLSVNLGW